MYEWWRGGIPLGIRIARTWGLKGCSGEVGKGETEGATTVVEVADDGDVAGTEGRNGVRCCF